ncbi:MAG: methylmalonyl-CoA epimerase [Candidatus Binatia bacterium]|nr:MAG: methylmalonyl-CoA epimerase [Candidatus Binatia bacterium]
MKILGVDHIGIAVEDIEKARRFYVERLGLPAGPIEDRPEYGLRLCRVSVGEIELELLEARDWEETTQKYLPYRGPGVYHFGLRVEDVDACVEELDEAGVPLIDRVPREGDEMRVSFLAPEASSGALIELVTRLGGKGRAGSR